MTSQRVRRRLLPSGAILFLQACLLICHPAAVLADAVCASRTYYYAGYSGVDSNWQGIDGHMTLPSNYAVADPASERAHLLYYLDMHTVSQGVVQNPCPYIGDYGCWQQVGDGYGWVGFSSPCNNVSTASCNTFTTSIAAYQESEDVNGYNVGFTPSISLGSLPFYTNYWNGNYGSGYPAYSAYICNGSCYLLGDVYLPYQTFHGRPSAQLEMHIDSTTGTDCSSPTSVQFGTDGNGNPLGINGGGVAVSPDGRAWQLATAETWHADDAASNNTNNSEGTSGLYETVPIDPNDAFVVEMANNAHDTRQSLQFLETHVLNTL
jgi:hypothetical protein